MQRDFNAGRNIRIKNFDSTASCNLLWHCYNHSFSKGAKMFKVALVGTHGVNKTTIAYELAGVLKRKGKSVELLTEIARECPFPLNERATSDAYQWIIARQVQLELEKAGRADVLVCDRSVLDNFAYYVRRYGNES